MTLPANQGALQRTIPDAYHRMGATTAVNLASLPTTHGVGVNTNKDLRGAWITIQNKTGAAIALARGPSSVGLPVAGQATSIEDGAKEEYFVDIDDNAGTWLRASAAGLLIGWDTRNAKVAG